MLFLNSFYFVTDGSFTDDGGLLSPTEGVNTTAQMTCFRGAKCAQKKWLQGKVIMNYYSRTIKLRILTRSQKSRKVENLRVGNRAQRKRQ